MVAIGYKYNSQKVLSFITIEGGGGVTTHGILYLFNYPDQFSNVSILSNVCPQVLYKFFWSFNEIDSHIKCRQYGLALDKLWVTQCGWLRLYTMVEIGIITTNFWKRFCCGVNREHYEKDNRIKEYSE